MWLNFEFGAKILFSWHKNDPVFHISIFFFLCLFVLDFSESWEVYKQNGRISKKKWCLTLQKQKVPNIWFQLTCAKNIKKEVYPNDNMDEKRVTIQDVLPKHVLL